MLKVNKDYNKENLDKLFSELFSKLEKSIEGCSFDKDMYFFKNDKEIFRNKILSIFADAINSNNGIYNLLESAFPNFFQISFDSSFIENCDFIIDETEEVSEEESKDTTTNDLDEKITDSVLKLVDALNEDEKIKELSNILDVIPAPNPLSITVMRGFDLIKVCESIKPGFINKYFNFDNVFSDCVNCLTSSIENNLIKTKEDIIKAEKEGEIERLEEELKDDKHCLVNDFNKKLIAKRVQYVDISLLDTVNYYIDNFDICVSSEKKDKENSVILSEEFFWLTAIKQMSLKFFDEIVDIIKSKSPNFVYLDSTKDSLIEEYTSYISSVYVRPLFISIKNPDSFFFPNKETSFLKKPWYLKSSILSITVPTGDNKDHIKSMLSKFKKKPNLNLQLIGDKRKKLNDLRQMFPNFMDVTNFIDSYLSIQEKSSNIFYFPPILLDGPPGIGKTFYLTMLSNIFGVDCHCENMASVSTGSRFTGTEKHWSSCDIGIVLDLTLKWEFGNSIILLDEIDKTRPSNHNGPSPVLTLLPLLERKSSVNMLDVSIDIPFDASNIIWTASSNSLGNINDAIRSRFNIFSIKAPNESERKILTQAIYSQLLKDNNWDVYFEPILSEETLNEIVSIDGGSARDTKRIIHGAMALAANEDLRYILPRHLPKTSNVKRMGF